MFKRFILLAIFVSSSAFAASAPSKAEDPASALLGSQIRDQVRALPRAMSFSVLTLPTKTGLVANLEWGAPLWDSPRVVSTRGLAPDQWIHEYHDMFALKPGSFLRVGDSTLRLDCVWVEATDSTVRTETRSRTLWIYLASNADGVQGCVGPVKQKFSVENEAWRAYLKLVVQGTHMGAPEKVTIKYGGVEYDSVL